MSKGPQSKFPAFKAKFEAPMTQHELMAATELTQASVSRFLHAMMDAEPKQAHIVDWRLARKEGGPPIAVYAPGPGDDAECTLRKLSGAERTRRHRRNKQHLQELAEARKASVRAAEPRHHYLTAALFGMAAC